MASDFTKECREGMAAHTRMNVDVPYLFSTAAWMAYRAGQQIRGMPRLRKCRVSRGDNSVRIEITGGGLIIVTFEGDDLGIITVERSLS